MGQDFLCTMHLAPGFWQNYCKIFTGRCQKKDYLIFSRQAESEERLLPGMEMKMDLLSLPKPEPCLAHIPCQVICKPIQERHTYFLLCTIIISDRVSSIQK